MTNIKILYLNHFSLKNENLSSKLPCSLLKVSTMRLRNGKVIGNYFQYIDLCSCGKTCDIVKTNKKCCYCSDKRKRQDKEGFEFRGHGIIYTHYSWSYCPKCAKTQKFYI